MNEAKNSSEMNIAIIGGGWVGCHLAIFLNNQGHNVVIFEKNDDIMKNVSGTFGIRLHAGPHYPRSSATRADIRKSFVQFVSEYPDLVVKHKYSIYALGASDADGKRSKIDKKLYDQVCKEFKHKKKISIKEFGYNNIISAHDLDEPSIRLGEPLRLYFRKKIDELKIPIVFNKKIEMLKNKNGKARLMLNSGEKIDYDYAINATGFTSLLPLNPHLPFNIQII